MCVDLSNRRTLVARIPLDPRVGSARVRRHPPTAALDPPHSAASPTVPALIGSGPPSGRLLKFGDLLEFVEQIGMVSRQMTDDLGILEQACDVS